MTTSSTPPASSWAVHVSSFLEKKPKKPLLTIVGPTASGKTAFSIELAHWLRKQGLTAEVVNADSRQFYRGLDVGTAKITEEEMEGVPHHLLSVLDPNDECTISWFQKEAARVIGEIHARGHLPLLVGGSMLYVSAIVDGLEPLPPVDQALRKKLEAEYDTDAGVTSYARLLELDPEAATFPRENKAYVVRALEIIESTGKKKSEQQRASGSSYDTLILGIDRDTKDLAERIEKRTTLMFKAGWMEEVKKLLAAGYTESAPAMQSHGYREIMSVLKNGSADQVTLEKTIAAKGRQYAKRHRTWWKDDARVFWIKP